MCKWKRSSKRKFLRSSDVSINYHAKLKDKKMEWFKNKTKENRMIAYKQMFVASTYFL